jgi:Zn-finger nucleic acid-binding protein
MDCPVCRIPMIVIEYRNIELDYCVDCKGVWFDAGEVNLLMEAVGLDPAQAPLELKPVKHFVAEAKRGCPLCTKAMEKVSPLNHTVILDRCRQGHGIWFDAGEVIQALTTASGAPGELDKTTRAITEFLGDALIGSHEHK